MRKIYVLDDNNVLQEVDAGATSYTELSDLPLSVDTLNTTVEIKEKDIVLTPAPEHKWTEQELNDFCGIIKSTEDTTNGKFDYTLNVRDGRFDIITEDQGHEILIIDSTAIHNEVIRKCRRITSQYDWVYSEQAKKWVTISDTSAGALIFTWEDPPENITFGTNVVLHYNYYSATGKIGTVQCFVNENLRATVSRNSSTETYTMDITDFLSVGNNTVLLKVTAGGVESELYTKINVINLKLTSTFAEDKLYKGNQLDYVYSIQGTVEKTVFFKFDDLEPVTKTYTAATEAINTVQALDTTQLSHGIHTLRVWAEASVGASTVKTVEEVYHIPLWKDDSAGTIIVLKDTPTKAEQGSTVLVKYTPYHAIETSIPMELIYPASFNMKPLVFDAITGESRTWTFAAKELGEQEFTIKSEQTEVKFVINIEVGEQIDFERNNLRYELDLIGRDNALDNRSTIAYKTINAAPDLNNQPAIANMIDFNYANDGWLIDREEADRNILRINSTSKVTYPNMDLFTLLDDANSVGCSFDIDFKGRNNTNSNKPLIQLTTATGEGIFIKEQSVEVNISGSLYKVEYKAGERTRVLITIDPNKEEGTRRIMIYVNGVLSYVSQYSNSVVFSGYKTQLSLNPEFGFVDIYGLRLYGAALNMRQALNNYIASYNTGAERTAQREKNDIYAEDGVTVSYDKVKKIMPTFLFMTNDENKVQNLPPAKKQKRYGPVDYIDPVYKKDFSEAYKASKKKPVADVQGTSSQKYPRKNFKIKTNSKYSFNDKIKGEKVFTFKKDFMDSSHANNTGLAKLVQTLYFTPVPPQVSYIQWTAGELDEEGSTIYYDAYDVNGAKMDFNYIFDHGSAVGRPFPSRDKVNIIIELLVEKANPEDPQSKDKYLLAYYKEEDTTTQEIAGEIDVKGLVPTEVTIVDKSYVRTTVFGQPCAFFWQPLAGEQKGQYIYQGVYNFNTDKVSTENMELEEEGCLSFEFANNVSDGALFKACPNFTEVRSSFEYRAYQKDGVYIEIWEDYYDDDLTKWADGGYDPDEEADIPVLNALYGGNADAPKEQLHVEIAPGQYSSLNYPYLTNNVDGFKGEKPETLEAQYRISSDAQNIEAAHVASVAVSEEYKLADTIENDLGGDAYFKLHPDCERSPKKNDMAPGQAIGCQVINQDKNFVVQWGYEVDGSVTEWTNLCYVADLLEIALKEHEGVEQTDIDVKMKKGTTDTILWFYKYPIPQNWYVVTPVSKLYKAKKEIVSVDVPDKDDPNKIIHTKEVRFSDYQPFVPTSLEKFDMFEHMHQPIMDVVNWVCDCYDDWKLINAPTKFKNEISQHLNFEYTITYYVMALFAGAADSLAKNMFWNSYDGGHIWYPVWYDIDTCFGLSNDGHPNFPYSLEIYGPGSTLGTANIYNGASSHFWELVYASFKEEIETKYNELRLGRLTYDSVMEVLYKEQISQIAPAHYNEDANFSYLPFPSYYYTAQGSRYERLKYWVDNRFYYLDSKLDNDAYKEDNFELRNNANLPINITTDMTMYVGTKFGQDKEEINKLRCEAGKTVSFDPKKYGIANVNDLETIIYGASHITSLGDLSNHQVTSIKFPTESTSVLENLVIGRENTQAEIESGQEYVNYNFTELTIGKNNVLKVLDVSNCVNLGTIAATLDLSKCPSINAVKAFNTKLTTITIPDGSPIKTLHMPEIKSLKLVNQILLTDLQIESLRSLNSLTWENVASTKVTAEGILQQCYEQPDNTVLQTVRIIGFKNKKAYDSSWMDWFIKKLGTNDIGQSTATPYITGDLTIQGLAKDILIPYVKAFNKTEKGFCYVTTTDRETGKESYFKLVSSAGQDSYEPITEEDRKDYKLNLKLEQIVADENIFGVSGEGR